MKRETGNNGIAKMIAIIDEMTNGSRSVWMILDCADDRNRSYIEAPPQFVKLKKSHLLWNIEYPNDSPTRYYF